MSPRASTRLRLLPPADLAGPKARWASLELTPDMARRKMQGIRSYRSQAPRFDRLLLDFARANESFETAVGDRMTPGVARRWNDTSGRRRGLGGAELEDVTVTFSRDVGVRVDLTNHNRKIGKRSYLAVDHFTIRYKKHCGNALDLEFHCPLRIFIRIDLRDQQFSSIFLGKFVQGWGNHSARPAPWCPKIYQDRKFGFKNCLFECAVGDMNWFINHMSNLPRYLVS